MKGIILAGGLGTRLSPLTTITNKHLLPVYDKPMIFYPIETLVDAGLDDIMIVTGGQHAGEFLRLLGNGKDFGLKELHYAYQKGEGGIAEALGLTEHFADQDRIVVMLGDNIVEKSIRPPNRAAPRSCSPRSTIPRSSAWPRSTATASCASSRNRKSPRAATP
jgi:glucose-1-phosphate thymidylyltransferase